MDEYRPDMPQIDDTVTAENLHERAEQVAVPNFDWINQPVRAVVDGLLHVPPADQARAETNTSH